MINAQYISDALNGRREGNKYRCDCPVRTHRKAKMMVSDRDDGSIGIYCYGNCEFIEIVSELQKRNLWSKRNLSESDKREISRTMLAKEYEIAKIWIDIYEANKKGLTVMDISTQKDDMKYGMLVKKHGLRSI